ncbi:MAG: hypothetical protein ACOCUH_03355 [Bacteriovoracia bacterium]
MSKPLYVTLDARLDEEEPLAREVNEDYLLNGTFADLLEKMVDPNSDEFHSGYNAQEKEIVEYVTSILEKGNENPAYVQLSYFPNDGGQDIAVDIMDKISDYKSSILKVDSVAGESGEDQKFYKMDLAIETADPSGAYNLETRLEPLYIE